MIDEKTQSRSAATPTVRVVPPRHDVIRAFYRSSVGKKMIVAITGIILILFVIGHLLGNLQIFLGLDWIMSSGRCSERYQQPSWQPL